eukprot:Seg2135.5 transcript_id=Seg2135.5/GoldUCD/mRNA.D3Y31 product="hypothetical protein" protein_id=Seg2135.5/GoldUCD/D3Y31
MDKFPRDVRTKLIRNKRKKLLEWDMKDLLDSLRVELEILESHIPLLTSLMLEKPTKSEPSSSSRKTTNNRPRQERSTTSALHTRENSVRKCIFCQGSHEEKNCMEVTNLDELKRQRYSVKLPWKVGHKPLPSNYLLSLSRISSKLEKLRQKPLILKEYDAIIKEQLDKGIIERVTEMEQPSRVHYLPNQAVVREKAETTKVRVVYDASCKDVKKGTSLNDCLHVGASLTPLLFDILVRFRENCVPLVGDIEKAFLNIEIDPADRDVLRFLWPENIQDPNSEIAVYRFQRAVFGVNASPFLLNAVLRYHIEQYRETDPEFCDKLSADFYVDDLFTGARNVENAFKLYLRAKERMKEGGFRLRKWKTSEPDLARKIECEEGTENKTAASVEESYAKASLGTSDTQKATKILCITWSNVQDNLEFDLGKWASGSDEKTITKRAILRQIARLFDPLGLVQ